MVTRAGTAVPAAMQESNNPPEAEAGSGGRGEKRHSVSQLLPGWERHRAHLGLEFVFALSCCHPAKREDKGGWVPGWVRAPLAAQGWEM